MEEINFRSSILELRRGPSLGRLDADLGIRSEQTIGFHLPAALDRADLACVKRETVAQSLIAARIDPDLAMAPSGTSPGASCWNGNLTK